MSSIHLLGLVISCCYLLACSQHTALSANDTNGKETKNVTAVTSKPPSQFEKDFNALDTLIDDFSHDIEAEWGKEEVYISGKRHYVKYTNNYKSRARIDFTKGIVRVETVATDNPKAHLQQAITTTLLTPNDPRSVDLYSAAEIKVNGKPFLQGQVLDHHGEEITWLWRASRFAEFLIEHQLKTKKLKYQSIFYVEIPMVQNHTKRRSYQFADIVRKASKRYGIPEELIYAIIKTESSFNPYAVSTSNAYGLMQIVPKTAGKDVFKLIKKREGQPTPAYLFDPAKNIDMGTAYFYLLKNRYLKDIKNRVSKYYSMISAYNGGAGNVLKTFHSNRKIAIQNLNYLNPRQVFWALTNKHPSSETRRYLHKVTNYQKEFRNLY